MVYAVVMTCLAAGVAQAATFTAGEKLNVSAGEITVSEVKECSSSSQDESSVEGLFEASNLDLSCRARSRISDGFEAAEVSLGLAAAIMTCTTVGAPASVWFILGGSVSAMMHVVVKNLPCKDDTTDKEAHRMSIATLCEAVATKGIECVD